MQLVLFRDLSLIVLQQPLQHFLAGADKLSAPWQIPPPRAAHTAQHPLPSHSDKDINTRRLLKVSSAHIQLGMLLDQKPFRGNNNVSAG